MSLVRLLVVSLAVVQLAACASEGNSASKQNDGYYVTGSNIQRRDAKSSSDPVKAYDNVDAADLKRGGTPGLGFR